MKIIGVGDNTVDVYLRQNKMYPGGNAVNVPVLALRAGAEAAGYLGILGDDAAGKLLRDSLLEEKVDLARVRVIHGSNPKNAVLHKKGNQRGWAGDNLEGDCGGLQLRFTPQDIEYLSSYDVLHTSIHGGALSLLPLVREKMMVSLDFADGYTPEQIAAVCPYLDVAFFSADGLNKEEVEPVILRMLAAGAETVLCTMGLDGSVAARGTERIFQPSMKCGEPVVDTLGAGDAYIAAFLLEYWNSRNICKAALQGARFSLKAMGHYGAFGHGADAQTDDIVLKQ